MLLCAKVLGHLKIINFQFVPIISSTILGVLKISVHYSLIIKCLSAGTP